MNHKTNDPHKHKTGKPRLGPLNLGQLQELLKNARPKHKLKIERRIHLLESRKK